MTFDAPIREPRARTVTVKVGGLGWWHAAHIVLSVLTAGLWLFVYAMHAIVSAVTRPTVTLDVPEGARIEYYRGYPNVLMPDEYLAPDQAHNRKRLVMIGATAVLIVAMAIIGFLTIG